MKAEIIAVGNSKGIRIPKALLEQCGINGSVDIAVEGKKLVIRALKKKPREGWEEEFTKMAARGDDMTEELIQWRAFPTKFEEEEWEW